MMDLEADVKVLSIQRKPSPPQPLSFLAPPYVTLHPANIKPTEHLPKLTNSSDPKSDY